ncbi:head decoration protein [Paracoccus yeei]|uniref:head decoration protein n=1 Tax=Paracoccus yeei TaxID=147645 RepID=UPI00174DBD4D|nr:head decoration protein [Paracoccus yeei]
MPIEAPQNRAQFAGMPSQWSDTVTGSHDHVYAGNTPHVVTQDLPLALGQTVLAYTPVAWNTAGTGLIPAVEGTPAIGITLYDIVVPATGALPGVPVVTQACLNKDALNWDASFTTDAQKFAAFRGADTPTNIVVREVYRGSVVAQP